MMNTYIFCNNCGKNGHQFTQCKKPIISIGIITIRFNQEKNCYEYLLICRKDSLGYIDFLRGKYPLYNEKYILRLINEMSMTIGLVMLTIGNFLGGMWANESWGRYWGWDPKETWALISIMVYAFVIHMRLIPGLKGNLTFTIASVLSFGSIIMTYFGVNLYLAGLHSYAKDDQEISIVFIAISLAIVLVLSLLAYPWHKKFLKNNH